MFDVSSRAKLSVSALAERKIASARPRKYGLLLRAEEEMLLYGQALAKRSGRPVRFSGPTPRSHCLDMKSTLVVCLCSFPSYRVRLGMSKRRTEPEADKTSALAAELHALSGKLKRRLREQASAGDLTQSQLAVLGHLDRLGPTTVTALARMEGVRPQSMGATVG